MNYRVIFFDLDDTLYPPSAGLWDAIGDRITLYMRERMGLPAPEVAGLRDHYFRSFGTTLNGLIAEHHIDPQDYLDFVHDLPLDRYLQPDPELAALLTALPQRKYIFTNADAAHALRVMDLLGVREHFAGIVDIHALGFVNKPQLEAYWIAQSLAGEMDPAACVLVEDSLRNIKPAHDLGMTTVYVGSASPNGDVDLVLPRVTDLCRALPALNCRP